MYAVKQAAVDEPSISVTSVRDGFVALADTKARNVLAATRAF
jgi:hypothetical protein